MANITGTNGDNILTGTANDDAINGLAGADTIEGGDGIDIIIGGLGADKMSGGAGNDEFLVGGTEIVLGETIDGGTGSNKISTWGGDLSLATITNVQTLGLHLNSLKLSATQMAAFTSLTSYNNAPVTLTASTAGTYTLANKTVTGTFNLAGSSGNDKLVGNAAAQTLDGGDGNDAIVGGLGADTMLGGAGDDEFLAGGTEIAAGEIINGGAGFNTLSTWGGDLSLATITNVQKLGVHLNNIKLTAAQLTNFWDIEAYDGPVTITAASPGLYLLPYRSAIGIFNFIGSSGVDNIFGNLLTQTIDGGDGDDYLAAAKTIHGGRGDDTVDGTIIYGAVLYGDDGKDTVYGGIDGRMYGGNGNDYLAGSIGIDTIDGGNDNDVLRGYLSADTLIGGAGADRFVYSTTADSTATDTDVIIDFVEGTDKIEVTGLGFSGLSTGLVKAGQLKVSYDAALNRTTIADHFSSSFSLILNGDHLNISANDFIGLQNVINGTSGNDYLVGTSQNDILSGLDGNDVLQGGLGADTMHGGNGDDEFLAGGTEIAAGELIDGGSGFNTLSTWGGDLSLAVISNVQKLGVHLDHITMNANQLIGFNQIMAYDGPFTIYGSGSGQFILNDQISTDHFTFVGTSADDTIFNKPSDITKNSSIMGMHGNDTFWLGRGNETVYGGDGNDEFHEDGGVDQLYGNDGDDTFYADNNAYNNDLSIDGGSGIDTLIYYENSIYTALGISGAKLSNIEILGGYLRVNALQIHQYTLRSDGFFMAFNDDIYDFSNATISGSGGIHFMVGNNSRITGTIFSDTIENAGTNNVIHTGVGDDIIFTKRGNSTIFGDEGNDTFRVENYIYDPTRGTIDGGSGINTVEGGDLTQFTLKNIQAFGGNVLITSAQFHAIAQINEASSVFMSEAGTYDLQTKTTTGHGFTFSGSSGHDTILGSEASDHIICSGGNDEINGNGGDDSIVILGAGNDTLSGGAGDDTFSVNEISTAYTKIIDGGSGYNKLIANKYSNDPMNLANMQLSNIQEVSGGLLITPGDLAKYKIGADSTLYAAVSGSYDLSGIQSYITFFGTSGNDIVTLATNSTGYINVGEGNDEVHGGRNSSNVVYAGNGFNKIYGGAEYDVLTGGTDKDIIYGYEDNDILDGQGGGDDIFGGTGDDNYLGSGMAIYEDDSTQGNTDVLNLTYSSIAHDQLWFTQSGNDLDIFVLGRDHVIIKDWYLGTAHHVEQIRSSDGRTLLDTQVQNLVNAMASFAVPSTTTLSAEYRTALDPILTANWT